MNAAELETLVGGLLIVGVRGASVDDKRCRTDLDACAAARVGGVALFDVDAADASQRNIQSPAQTAALCSDVRATLGASTLICVDQEGGAVARLRHDLGFAAHESAQALARRPARERAAQVELMAAQLKALGIDLNLAPCVDVASQRSNAVVVESGRCFSDEPNIVIECAAAMLDAHRRLGVLSCVKHFPGHGCSIEDSHQSLPDITTTFDASRDLAPYRALLRCDEAHRPDMVMTAHLLDRNVDADLPASLSAAHTQGALRGRLGWEGVVITDSLDMGAIGARWSPAEAAVLALNAGADLVLFACNPADDDQPHPAPALTRAIRTALKQGNIAGGEARLKASADRIARVRARCSISARAMPR